MQKIVIYTKSICPYCVKAKVLLDRKGSKYEEINIGQDAALVNEMLSKSSGRKTVPQIFIGDYHVGGCDDLYELERKNELDALLK